MGDKPALKSLTNQGGIVAALAALTMLWGPVAGLDSEMVPRITETIAVSAALAPLFGRRRAIGSQGGDDA